MSSPTQAFDFMGLILAKRFDVQLQSETVLAMLQAQTAFENETMTRALVKNMLRPVPQRPLAQTVLEKPVTPIVFG